MATGYAGTWGGPVRLALSDGASTTSFSRLWARILVQAATRGIAPWARASYRSSILTTLRLLWNVEAHAALPESVPWFASGSLERGAFATLLRVRIHRGMWEAEAWGDSCLFHLRAGRVLQMLPNLEPEDFALAPCLLASVPGHDRPLSSKLVLGQGHLRRGDQLILTTDALACWFRSSPDTSTALEEALGVPDQAGFTAWVDGLRSSRGLKNDDTTLLVATIP